MKKFGKNIFLFVSLLCGATPYSQEDIFYEADPLAQQSAMETPDSYSPVYPQEEAPQTQPNEAQGNFPEQDLSEPTLFPDNTFEQIPADEPFAPEPLEQPEPNEYAQSTPQEVYEEQPQIDTYSEQPSNDDPVFDQPAYVNTLPVDEAPSGYNQEINTPPADYPPPSYEDPGTSTMEYQNEAPPPPQEPLSPSDEQIPP